MAAIKPDWLLISRMKINDNLKLPERLFERCAIHGSENVRTSGEFVLYWAHHALRAHENPALDTAAALAINLDLPLLVYQGLGGRHRYNSDRHHRFILESARDFSAALKEQGQRLVFHLPHDPSCPGPLGKLLARSAVTVSELYPVPPFTGWYRQHIAATPELMLVLVDASCILPMPLSSERPNRAYLFRKNYRQEIDRRVKQGWKSPEKWPAPFTGSPGFEAFDLSASLPEEIAQCRIDHSIPPVSETRGGAAAGYDRWQKFLSSGLKHYHRLRDDATVPSAVSRMSAYLHYGCVSPFRIAIQAAEQGGEGADKFLDELLTWRELSHHFCFHCDDPESLNAIPRWASDSLKQNEALPREMTFDWETLARARTGNPLWDLAQRSLLRHGELHNNLRMTWGKAILPWSQTTSRALKLMIDLNHRFAFDGSDPNSYGGLLWCLGQFDRACPPGPVFGKVRQRSLARHAKRLDIGRYAQLVKAPANGRCLQIAVIGAGMAGLTAARVLIDQGHDVVVVDKARGAGGRMSTRREGEYRFDHGAQYFTARDPRFRRHVLAWRERGLVESWTPRIAVVGNARQTDRNNDTERFVGVPGMNAICKELAVEQSDCRFGWNVKALEQTGSGWTLHSNEGEKLVSDALIITTPPVQASALLSDPEISETLAKVEMLPCWSVMLVLDRPLLADHDAAFVNEGPLSWVSCQASRFERTESHTWVLHANPEWSRQHLESSREDVIEWLLEAAQRLPCAQSFSVRKVFAHRWRYALARKPLEGGALWFASKNLALAGDWCNGSRVEGAFLSGAAAAGQIMGSSR